VPRTSSPNTRPSPKRTKTLSERGGEPAPLKGVRLLPRLGAGLVDAVLALAIMAGLAFAATALGGPFIGLRFVAVLTPLLYFIIPEVYYQATPGKLLFGLRVVTIDGARPDVLAHTVRAMTRVPEALVLVPYLFVVPFSERHQRFGDSITETLVVKKDQVAGGR
jgi:uncharacterized RDD family membrane protein YckC